MEWWYFIGGAILFWLYNNNVRKSCIPDGKYWRIPCMWAAGSSLQSFPALGLSETCQSESQGQRNSLAQSQESGTPPTPAEHNINTAVTKNQKQQENQLWLPQTYLSSANFKVIIVDVDGGDRIAHWELLHWGIRKSISWWWRCNHLTDVLNLGLLLLCFLTRSLKQVQPR